METLKRKRFLQEKFDLGEPIKGNDIPDSIKNMLNELSKRYKFILEMGRFSRRIENRKYGGSHLPHEDKNQFYWKKG